MILVCVLYAILALTFVIAKQALSYAQPFFLIATRMLCAGTLLLSYQYIMHRKKFFIKKSDAWFFVQAALFHIYFAFVLEFWALQFLSSSKTNLMYSSTPFIAALLSYYLLGERLSRRKMGAIVLGLVGLLPVLVLQAAPSELATIYRISAPELVLMLAIVSAAYAWFVVKKLMNRGYGLVTINGAAMFGGGVLAALTSLVFEVVVPTMSRGQHEPLIRNSGQFIFWVALLIITANVVVYNLYGWLLRRYSMTFLTFAGFLCPIFGAFFGWLFLAEAITWYYFCSLGVIMVALYLFYREEIGNLRG